MHQQEYNKRKTGETRIFIEERIIETQKELNRIEEKLKTLWIETDELKILQTFY